MGARWDGVRARKCSGVDSIAQFRLDLTFRLGLAVEEIKREF
jgi:hypothetical protein